MHSLLFEVWGTQFPSYFVLIFVGFLFATIMATAWARRVGQNPDVMVDLGLVALLSGFGGARLLHVLADGHFMDYVHACTAPNLVDWFVTEGECTRAGFGGVWDSTKAVCHPVASNCFAWAEFWSGGFTFYGGLIGATFASWRLFRRDRFPFWKGADMGGMMVPIGLGFGRLGCLLAGCCFGSVTDAACALHFPARSPASDWQAKAGLLSTHLHAALPVYPTQILEAGGAFAIAAFGVLYFHSRKRYDGHVFVMFLMSYAVLRFCIEFLRSDDRGGFGWFSTSQWISVVLFISALIIHLQRGRRPVGQVLTALLVAVLSTGCGDQSAKQAKPAFVSDCEGSLCRAVAVQGSPAGSASPSATAAASGSVAAPRDVIVVRGQDVDVSQVQPDTQTQVRIVLPNAPQVQVTLAGATQALLPWGELPTWLRVDVASGSDSQALFASTLRWLTDAEKPAQLLVAARLPYEDVANSLVLEPTTLIAGNATVVLRMLNGSGAPLEGVRITVSQGTLAYDAGASFSDALPETGARGMAVWFNAPVPPTTSGSATILVENAGNTQPIAVPLIADGLTLLNAVLK